MGKKESAAITWMKVTDYMHDWLEKEFGCELRARGVRVLCLHDLEGAREILKMETNEDGWSGGKIANAISVTRMKCLDAGLRLDPDAVRTMYGIDAEALKLYMPIECPRMALTENGVLRPWTWDTTFGRDQTVAMHRLLRNTFWKAVAEFDEAYNREVNNENYPAKEMIQEFCRRNKIGEIYIDALRREWQRRKNPAKDGDLEC